MRNVQKANTVASMAATFGKPDPFLNLFKSNFSSGSCLGDKACDYETGLCWEKTDPEEQQNCAAGKLDARAN